MESGMIGASAVPSVATRSTMLHFSFSTPFEADLYKDDDDDDDNPYFDENNRISLGSSKPLAVQDEGDDEASSTRLVIGLNKYSHDTSLCAADAKTGQVLYAQAKERIGGGLLGRQRQKHAAGNVATLVETCLDALQLDLSNVDCVVMNNHHYRVLPSEPPGLNDYDDNNECRRRPYESLEWEAELFINGGQEDGYLEPENLFPTTPEKWEVSHHLAHAYSVAAQAPFDEGMIVVMDGMGETYRTMQNGALYDPQYVCDFNIPTPKSNDNRTVQLIPSNLHDLARDYSTVYDWREAESVYTFTKQQQQQPGDNDKSQGVVDIVPVFKRFTKEHTPPVLYNHGFENMDSLGALYSRTSSHIFGDWNACGKVMGLAPWAGASVEGQKNENGIESIRPHIYNEPIVSGTLYHDGDLIINRTLLQGIPLHGRNDPDLFRTDYENEDDRDLLLEPTKVTRRKPYDFDRPDPVPDYNDDNEDATTTATTSTQADPLPPTQVALEAMALAYRMQIDLERVAMDFIKHFQKKTGHDNICLAGGVALNSVLNGRLSLELQKQSRDGKSQKQLFIPPYPGDEGIAVGCCAYGLFGRRPQQAPSKISATTTSNPPSRFHPPIWQGPLSPYSGGLYSEIDIEEALDRAAPWIDVELVRDPNERHRRMVEEISSGGVIAWYHSRSEMGPRALGHRSILADPRKYGLVRFINQYVKKRETFRPFAPSVLAEEAPAWFEGIHPNHPNISPYMSLTAQVRQHERHKIPAVTHIDGSSRLQTVTRVDEPAYHALITQFWKKTGVPMVLNTSFNTLPGEPIVETPTEAIRSFLYTKGNLEMLVMEDYIIRRKPVDLRKLLGSEQQSSTDDDTSGPARPKRVGAAHFQAQFSLPQDGPQGDESSNAATTWVQMPDRILHVEDNNKDPASSLSWYELVDELEGEIMSACDGSLTLNEMLARFTAIPNLDKKNKQNTSTKNAENSQDNKKAMNSKDDRDGGVVDEETNTLVQNVIYRLVRLYEETFIYW